MPREHQWSFGHCSRCGYSTDLAGGDIDDAPPCDAWEEDFAERIVDVVAGKLGVNPVGSGKFSEAVNAVTQLLEENR